MDDAIALNRLWAERSFASSPAPAGPACAIAIAHEDVAGDTKIGRCAFGGPLRLGDKVYQHGIGVNSHSVLHVTLDRPAARLVGVIGLDRNVDNTAASVCFRVAADGKELFATEVIRPKDGPRPLDLPLGGARILDLTVDDGGDGRGWDQGDWADIRVVCDDGTVVWLDDLARQWTRGGELAFSFVYGGKPSAELLPAWRRELSEQTVPGGVVRTLTLTDPATGLEVRAVCTVYTDTPGADWTLHFTNRGQADTPALEQVWALDSTARPMLGSAPAVLHRLHGSRCAVDDWLPFDDPLPAGANVTFAAGEGKSSQGVSPFFNVEWGTGGVITAVGWSGQWQGAVTRAADGAVRLQAGMQLQHLRLKPGESVRTPRTLQLHWQGGDEAESYNLFRRTMLAHVVPRVSGAPVTPPIVHLSTSFYELNDSTEANTLSHLEAIRGLGFEMFWLDAYWTRDGFPNGMGNYGLPLERVEPPDRFPHGLRPIGDAAHEAGMGFVVWFEPERVAAGTHLAREHPEWVVQLGADGGGMFDLGNPDARQYMTDYLIAAVHQYGIGCLRIDYNFNPLPFWRKQNAADPDRVGLAEIRYVEGLYRMWDDVRAACPGLWIDNCASGGMRIDPETCSRSIPLWRTDATIDPLFRHDFDQAALQNQVMTAGLSRYVPYSVSGQMGVTPYQFRSGFNAGIAFCEDCRPAGYPKAMLKQAIAEGKRLRKYFAGDLYVLSEVTTSPRDWCVLQYHRPAEGDGMVMAYRRQASPYGSYCCELRGIDAAATYEVTTSPAYVPGKPVSMKGADLARLTVAIAERPGAVVVEYRRR
ncbi:MAG: alpha-galactosidase [Armatimonadetes bacterium]|nr:alpha-galactosidase [Armatimonadota bacterium]